MTEENKELLEEMQDDLNEEVVNVKEVNSDDELVDDDSVHENMDNVSADMLTLINDMDNRYKRLQADFDNFRKRTQGEKEQLGSYLKGELINQLLPVLDNFERALMAECDETNKAYKEGFEMIYKSFEETLKRMGLKEIEALGKEFDPQYHQAVMNGPSDEYEDNVVCQVLQKGYEVEGKVIRPVMVKVVNNG